MTIVSNNRGNHQLKRGQVLPNLNSFKRRKLRLSAQSLSRAYGFLWFFVGFLTTSWATGSWGYGFPPQIKGMDLVQGRPIQVEFKQARLGTVLIFLSSRCPCSASHQPVLNRLSKEFTSQGFRFLGIHSNVDEDAGVARAYFKESGLTFPVIQDPQARIADMWGAFKTPHVFVLSPDGEILFQGGVDNSHIAQLANKDYLRDALALIVGGKKPSQKEVRVLGCEIRR